jgi:uncharacterized FlgJ-related protein
MKIFLLSLYLLFFFPTSSETNSYNLTHSDFYDMLVKYEIKYPDIVFAQAVLESGNFTSKLFKTQNNLFGMKVPHKRQTTAINKIGYAKYNSIDDSIIDYSYYQQYAMKRKEMSRNEYLAFLGRNYAEDKKYVQKLNKTIKKHNEILN